MDRRQALKQLAAVAGLTALNGKVFAQREPFTTLDPAQPTDDKARIELIEFFHYGCPHCRDFDPLLEAWLTTLPNDAYFKRVPAIWGNPGLRSLAQLYYAAEATGTLHELHGAVFDAYQSEKRPLTTADGVRDWVRTRKVDADKFMAAYGSFGIQSKLARADQIAKGYRIQGVPTMAVNGKYITSASLTGSHENTLKVVEDLIARARTERR